MTNPSLDICQHWQALLLRDYGIEGVVTPLDGEFDLNYAVHDDTGMCAVLKVMRTGCEPAFVTMQLGALSHIAEQDDTVPVPRAIAAKNGALQCLWSDPDGAERVVWVIAAMPGKPLAQVRPHTIDLMQDIGRAQGAMARALAGYDHALLDRSFKWHPLTPDWALDKVDVVADPVIAEQVRYWLTHFVTACRPALATKPATAIQCDANDYNILVEADLDGPRLSGLIDFGDMVRAPLVCDLATAAAYMVLNQERPLDVLAALVSGFAETCELDDVDLGLIGPLMMARLSVSIVNAAMMQQERPDDPYVTISLAPALAFFAKARAWSVADMHQRMRVAVGQPVVPAAPKIDRWLTANKQHFAPLFGETLVGAPMCSCAVGDVALPVNPTALQLDEAGRLVPEAVGSDVPHVGHYLEPRLVYTEPAFLTADHPVDGRRTLHLGVDVFLPADRPVHAPLDGIVVTAVDRARRLDYGGVVILAHETDEGDAFFTLYGHLDPASIADLVVGQKIAKGAVFARLGAIECNGGWQPHIHFQLSYSGAHSDHLNHDWPGVADADDLAYQSALYPNPAALLGLAADKLLYSIQDTQTALADRQARFGQNLKLSYKAPVQLLRGWKHYLYDEAGRTYLDAYNNVPHVGHAHPRLQEIAATQLQLINTNTRYLHPAQMQFADALRDRMPAHLTHCYFVTSGSEANELALRLARAHTGQTGMIVQDHAYHGHTTGTIDLSPYKFNGPGGAGKPDWVEITPVADPYRGPFGYDDPQAGEKYASMVAEPIATLSASPHGLAGFIAESFPSVGGQIEPPAGYLAGVYDRVRAAGGLCIADEVQTGLGRLGDAYWGFETQHAQPDMVVLGKPLGNGHPIGAVVTTAAIAESFANGMEFFSTFGGTTLACRLGAEVLNIVDAEGLQENARLRGTQLLDGLRDLQTRYPVIGDVRGRGLFIGAELVLDRERKTPATLLAGYVSNRLRAHRILIGTDGPFDNVLKIRPPLTVGADDCALLLRRLDQILGEAQIIAEG